MERATLKNNAKASLKGKYGDAILLTILYLAINYVAGLLFNFIAIKINIEQELLYSGRNITMYVISCITVFGYESYYLKISRKEQTDFKELFSKTKLFGNALIITFLVDFLKTIGLLLFIVPGIIISLVYSQVYFIKLDNPELGITEVLKKSRLLMKGHKMDYFVLQLSFLGWIILGVFTFGILYLWLIPYMSLTAANFYNELIKTSK